MQMDKSKSRSDDCFKDCLENIGFYKNIGFYITSIEALDRDIVLDRSLNFLIARQTCSDPAESNSSPFELREDTLTGSPLDPRSRRIAKGSKLQYLCQEYSECFIFS